MLIEVYARERLVYAADATEEERRPTLEEGKERGVIVRLAKVRLIPLNIGRVGVMVERKGSGSRVWVMRSGTLIRNVMGQLITVTSDVEVLRVRLIRWAQA